jgi:copper chaperone NosL
MCEKKVMNRRRAMQLLAGTGIAGFSGFSLAAPQSGSGAMIPGVGWVKASREKCEHDGTPLQFMPKSPPDDNPLENELEKYPRCPYCGMSRSKWQHSRHLVHYDDGLVDGTCSIHCLAISLSLNLDRGPKAIYAADFGAEAAIKPLIEVSKATYLVGSELKGTMSANSKMAFASADRAKSVMGEKGGELADFNQALEKVYLGMARDTTMIRKRRLERRKKMMQKY